MRRFGKLLGRVLAFLFLLLAMIWLLAPDDPVDRVIGFDAGDLGDDLDAWLAEQELQFSDIVPETGKRIVWAGAPGAKTPLAVIYVHGFSATWHEIAPVPQRVAEGLGANLFLTRLAGHGRGSAAMAEPEAGDWIEDMAEAMAIGRRLGERVLVIGTSTGGTLAVLAASDPVLSQGLAGVVLVSPNFGVTWAAGLVLDLPLVRHWGPLLAGETQTFAPRNADQARYWTTSYPTTALFPMAALVRHVRRLDLSGVTTPALLLLSEDDGVVDPARTRTVMARWGGPLRIEWRTMGQGDDAWSHVIAGDILSPGQTEQTVALILDWAAAL